MPIDAIISESLRLSTSIDINSPMELLVQAFTAASFDRFLVNQALYYYIKPRAMVSKIPGFFFSSYTQSSALSPALISIDNYMKIMQSSFKLSYQYGDIPMPTEPPVRALYLKLNRKDTTVMERQNLINGLKTYMLNQRMVITDINDIIISTNTALAILDIFFDLVALTIIVLCFFVLLISFTSNITENSWEFGVLRAIGLNAFQVIRSYIYEALAIILSSVVLGFIIGDLVSITLTLQVGLFSELPFIFEFPTLLFVSIVVMALIVSILGSYIPASQLKKKKIALALKNM